MSLAERTSALNFSKIPYPLYRKLSDGEIREALTPAAPTPDRREELVELLLLAATELVTTRIYEDPYAQPVASEGKALYCSECMRYGVSGQPIEHTSACVAGRVSGLIRQIRKGKPDAQGVMGSFPAAARPDREIVYFPQPHPTATELA